MRNGVIITAIGSGTRLSVFAAAQCLYVQTKENHSINVLADIKF